MPRKSKKPVRKQTHSPTGKVVGQVGQILLPMIAGIASYLSFGLLLFRCVLSTDFGTSMPSMSAEESIPSLDGGSIAPIQLGFVLVFGEHVTRMNNCSNQRPFSDSPPCQHP